MATDDNLRQQLEADLGALYERWRQAVLAAPLPGDEERARLGKAGVAILGEAFQLGQRYMQAAPILQVQQEIVMAAAQLRAVMTADLGSKQRAYEHQAATTLVAALAKLDDVAPEAAEQLRAGTETLLSRWRDEGRADRGARCIVRLAPSARHSARQ